VARDRISELRASGVKLVTAIDALLEPKSQERLRYASSSRLAKSRRKKLRHTEKGKTPVK
jgi:hypothetical protein